MPRTIIRSRLHSNKYKPRIKQELNNTKSTLPPHLQTIKLILFSGNGIIVYKRAWKFFNY